MNLSRVILVVLVVALPAIVPATHAISFRYYSGYVQASCFLGLCSIPWVSGVAGSIQVSPFTGYMVTNTVAFWLSIGSSSGSWVQTGWVWGLTPDGIWHSQPLLYIDYQAFGIYSFLPLQTVNFGETHSFNIALYYSYSASGYRANVTVDGAVRVLSIDFLVGQNQAMLEAFDGTTQVQATFTGLQYESVGAWYSWTDDYVIITMPYWVWTYSSTSFQVIYMNSGGGGGGAKKA